MMKTAIIGGGAAGFFLAVTLKEMMPEMDVTLFERGTRVLRKVAVSGGGRCNCTNSFEGISDLQAVYPRGHRLMKRLMKGFSQRDACPWFERHDVRLTTQADHCVFPQSQQSQTIIQCFEHYCRRYGVTVSTGVSIGSLAELAAYDFVCVTIGGQPHKEGLDWLAALGHEIVAPVPSLFTFNIDDAALRALMGTVVEQASAMIPATSFRASGPLLVTHWGISGPAILRLSSYAARHLSDSGYQSALSVNWTDRKENSVVEELQLIATANPQKMLANVRPFDLPQRLWSHLLEKSLAERAERRWADLSRKDLNRLVNTLTNDNYLISGRAPFKDEFVTCGGISLSSVNAATLESRTVPHLYFAGEVLDIDGVTGGFNFQAAWTTAHTVASAIVREAGNK
ncbi:MAG: aminoacetone oxidase family FAD-binding enzyme [Selenomonas sp.]|nr:aminoacetone oxidase family FAD-binding enzyme [Selenomonas sp.]